MAPNQSEIMPSRISKQRCNIIGNQMYYVFQVIPLHRFTHGQNTSQSTCRSQHPQRSHSRTSMGAPLTNDPPPPPDHLELGELRMGPSRTYVPGTSCRPSTCKMPIPSTFPHRAPAGAPTPPLPPPPTPGGWPGTRIRGQQVAGVGGDVG